MLNTNFLSRIIVFYIGCFRRYCCWSDFYPISLESIGFWWFLIAGFLVLFECLCIVHYYLYMFWWDALPLEILLHSLSFLLCLNNNLHFIDLLKKRLFIYVLIPVGLKFKFVIIGKNWVRFRICIMQVMEVGDFFFIWSIPLHCLNCRWCCRCFPILD